MKKNSRLSVMITAAGSANSMGSKIKKEYLLPLSDLNHLKNDLKVISPFSFLI